jgi:hypothetical protein
MGDREHLFNHGPFFLLTPRFHRRSETVMEMSLHELGMGGTEESHDSEILLHDIDTVRIFLDHPLDSFEETLRFAIAREELGAG